MSEQQIRTLPLQGKHVLVTRTRDQAGVLSEQLRAAGALPVELPVIRIVPPEDWSPLDQALRALAENAAYDWLIFTSANGVKMALDRLSSLGLEPQMLATARIPTIPPPTPPPLPNYPLSPPPLPH